MSKINLSNKKVRATKGKGGNVDDLPDINPDKIVKQVEKPQRRSVCSVGSDDDVQEINDRYVRSRPRVPEKGCLPIRRRFDASEAFDDEYMPQRQNSSYNDEEEDSFEEDDEEEVEDEVQPTPQFDLKSRDGMRRALNLVVKHLEDQSRDLAHPQLRTQRDRNNDILTVMYHISSQL